MKRHLLAYFRQWHATCQHVGNLDVQGFEQDTDFAKILVLV